MNRQLFLPGNREQPGTDPAQSVVVFAAQVVEAVLVAKLVDEQPDHILSYTMLEPVRSQPEFIEVQAPNAAARKGAEEN